MRKRVLAFSLALIMLIGFLPINVLASGAVDQVTSPALESLKAQAEDLVEDEQEVLTFIVEVEDPTSIRKANINSRNAFGASSFGYKQEKSAKVDDSLIQSRLSSQDAVLDKIFGNPKAKSAFARSMSGTRQRFSGFRSTSSDSGNAIVRNNDRSKDIPRFVAILNGFSMEMTYAEAKRVALVDGVKKVALAIDYKRPNMTFSRDIVNAPISVARGYDGSGRVVAVLDTGIDVNHQDLRIDEDKLASVKYTNEAMNSKIAEYKLYGKYATSKVPYVYNYADRNFKMMSDDANHGQHIAGTIAGNGDASKGGVCGIVPNAQILGMRVFGDGNGLTNTSIYVEAIDDAIVLGADAINMSLGSYAGAADGDDVLDLVVKRANEAGCIVTFAGGNDAYAMSNIGKTNLDMIDFSTLGSPGSSKDVFTVASFNNSTLLESYVIKAKNNGQEVIIRTNPGSSIETAIDTGLQNDVFYDYVEVGLGNTEADYSNKNVAGKVVLAQRGGGSFTDKAKLAGSKGAIAIIIGDNQDKEGIFTMNMEDGLIPAFYIWKSSYEQLLSYPDKKVSINNYSKENLFEVENPDHDKMSDFSSWGPTPNLSLKPEITAPGGNIRSIDNGVSEYVYMSGTSMATPHVVGGIAAVNSAVASLNIPKSERSEFIKKVMMNTARLIPVAGTEDYYSVRLQGAGLMDLDRATNGLYVTVEDGDHSNPSYGKGKIELGKIDNTSLPISLKLKNYSDKSVSYNVYSVIQTDYTENGKIFTDMSNYKPRSIQKKTKIDSISLPAYGEEYYSTRLTFDDSHFASEFNNGYYVDAFIILEPMSTEADGGTDFVTLSLPLLAFKGNWEKDIPIIEKFIDKYSMNGEYPFWVENVFVSDGKLDREKLDASSADMIDGTYFYSNVPNILTGQGFSDVIGRGPSGQFTDNFAISPNADQSQDAMTFKGVFLRNYSNFHMLVRDENGGEVNKIYNTFRQSGIKTGFTVNMKDPITSTTSGIWTWDGRDSDGNIVSEGKYYIDINARIQDSPEAPLQTITREVLVDLTSPVIENYEISADKGLYARASVSDNLSKVKAVYLIDSINENYYLMEERNGLWEYNDPKLTSTEGLIIKAVDWAGNTTLSSDATGQGKLLLKKVNEFKQNDIPSNIIQAFKVDDQGNKLSKSVTNFDNLADGKYVLEFKNFPANYKVKFEPSNTFEIVDGSTEEVTVKFERVDTSEFGKLIVNVIWPNDYPGFINIFAKDADGNRYQLESEYFFDGHRYAIDLPEGEYEVFGEGSNDKLNLIGPRLVKVSSKDITSINLQVSDTGEYIKFYFVSPDIDLFNEWFKKEDIKVVKADKGDIYYLENFFDYFDVYNNKTGTHLKDSDLELKNGEKANTANILWHNDKNSIEAGEIFEVDLSIQVPYGEYNIVPKNPDTSEYIFDFVSEIMESNEDGPWKGFSVSRKDSNIKGTIKAITGFVPGEEEKDLKVSYELYDVYNNLLKETSKNIWENLSQGIYYLKVVSDEIEYVPEKDLYKLEVVKSETLEQVVRFKNINADPIDRYSTLNIGIYGDHINELGDISFIFKDRISNNVVKTITINPSRIEDIVDELIPFGSYQVEVDMSPNYSISGLYLSKNDYKNIVDELFDNGSKFNFTISNSYNEIEMSVTNKSRSLSSLKIHESGLDNKDRIVYYLSDGDRVVASSNDGYFRNIKSGLYTLTISSDLYEVLEVEQDGKILDFPYGVSIRDGENHVSVKFTASTHTNIKSDRPDKSPIDKDNSSLSDFIIWPERGIGGKEKYPERPTRDNSDNRIEKDNLSKENDYSNHWAKDVIKYVLDKGYMKEDKDRVFNPDRPTTRYEVVKALGLIEKVNPNDFKGDSLSDIDSSSEESGFVNWAIKNNIVHGYEDGTFKGDQPITREEMAKLLNQYVENLKKDRPLLKEIEFKDGEEIGDWAKEDVKKATERGLMKGTDEGKFEPKANLSKAEVAQIVYNIEK